MGLYPGPVNLESDALPSGHRAPFFSHMSLVMRKPDLRLCENKDSDQLCSNCTADQRLCFHYSESTISLLPKYRISSF